MTLYIRILFLLLFIFINKFYYQKQIPNITNYSINNLLLNNHSAHFTMSQQMNSQQVLNQLMNMLEYIFQNANYKIQVNDPNILTDPKMYFDICQIIFAELSIKIIKIQEIQDLDDGEKLDMLIQLIISQLGIQDQTALDISGRKVVEFDIPHIYQLLNLLNIYSELFNQRGGAVADLRAHIKTQPDQKKTDHHTQGNRKVYPFGSARPGRGNLNQEYHSKSSREDSDSNRHNERALKQNLNGNNRPKNGNYSYDKNGNSNGNGRKKIKSMIQKSQNIRPQSSQPAKKKKSQFLYDQLVKVVIQQKNRANKSSLRDQRKNKNVDVMQAKYKYKQYLKSYSKQKRAESQKKSFLKKRSQTIVQNSNPRQLPLQDFQNVSNFFKSFNYKLRDMKDVYLRRMQKQIRQKQQQKMIYKTRIQRQNKKLVDKLISQQLQCLNNQHLLRKSQIKQAVTQLESQISLVQKQMKRKSSIRKKQLKQMKKMDLKNLENLIKQENERILMELEAGGRMEKLILDVYGKL